MRTVQQERASFALKKVKEIAIENREEFRKLAESFPAMIRMNGLGQAAAFYFSKREKEKNKDAREMNAYERLYLLLGEWLTKPGQPYASCENLLQGITQQNMHAYRLAQAEALLLLDWVKKFAKAFAGEENV
ncbi:type III-B CRISPR module-associated protein Cmr5 [Methylocaldum szegediense]|uniref:CRISPR type III-B/RAMP module-associated protein Cmr5 n=1 Tax=Methylocaldum szegediense TaxID=73780 RepID=A0ABM9I969_9GAMM|nr:type III-B CRISPR module-associated protein Cmr5 [Methylocaldum szegediense]CAI8970077.1 CRISPR-associated protein Cmr5 [Methylocaldum szegediense]